jgi:hypothetical protein
MNGRFKNELKLEDFASKTINLLVTNILKENRLIISRVLETNVAKAFGEMVLMMQYVILSKNGRPLVELYLTPIERLEDIGKGESKKIGETLKNLSLTKDISLAKELILNKNRGISTLDYVTQLRHLWLYCGTVTFAYALHSKFDSNFKFCFGNKSTSARDTIALNRSIGSSDTEKYNDDIRDLFYVQIDENGVGLDGVFYKFVGTSDFGEKLREETVMDRFEHSSKNEFLKIFDFAEEMEKRLFNNLKLRNAIENEKLDIGCSLSKEFQIPSVINMWKSVLESITPNDVNMNNFLSYVGTMQNKIELYLSKIKGPLEESEPF